MDSIKLETDFGPRAQIFEALCTETCDRITTKICEILIEDQPLTDRQFATKRITAEGQGKLANLDDRVSVLFKNIIADVCVKLAVEKREMLSGFMMLAQSLDDVRIPGQFIQETALPYVEELVTELDDQDPELINEAISGGVAPEQQQILDLFKVVFNT